MSSAPVSKTVILDYTLRDLYALDATSEQDVLLVYGMPDAKVQLTSSIPLSTRYVYQSPISKKEDKDILARLMLEVVGQVFGSIAGKLALILFEIDEDTTNPIHTLPIYQYDAFKTFAQIAESQRPDLRFAARPEDIVVQRGVKVGVAHPMDCLLHLPHTVDPEVHYGLLSKTNLALSSLLSPHSEVVNTELRLSQLQDDNLLDAEVGRMLNTVAERPLPFVIKLPLAVLGQGVFVILTEADREAALKVLNPELNAMLRQLNDSNIHLRPSSFVVQEFIPGESVSLSLFITRRGRAVLTSCCTQIADSEGHWGGAFISYKEQDTLQHRYAETIETIAKFMHEKGYYGPMGADVMTDPQGRHLIIDLNMRVTGSHPLGFLKTHFSTERNLHEAVVLFPLMLGCTRETFERAFESEFKHGSLVVNGWCHDQSCSFSITSIALAARNTEELRAFINRVNAYKLK